VGGLAVTVKLLPLVAVPPGVLTLMGPDVAPLGTVAEIDVAELTEKLALVPLNVTAVAPVKFVPLIVTVVPTGPLVGVKLVIVGAGGGPPVTVKLLLLVAVPPGAVTLIGPDVAPLGTVAVIDVAEFTEKLALVPLKRTAVAPVKFVPLIVTVVPTGPLVGEKPVMVGALAVTVKLLLLVAVPPGVLTLSGPDVAPLGTVAVIEVDEFTEKLALVPLKRTAVAPVKFVPLIVTVVPTAPLVGEKPLIVGAGGALDTVTVTGLELHRTPRMSVATAVKVCERLLVLVVSQRTEYGAEVSLPMKLPSTKNSTFVTVREPMMLTLALTGTVSLTVEPDDGDVMVTIRLPVGGGGSIGGGGRICAEA
jgi:hypothetical protein